MVTYNFPPEKVGSYRSYDMALNLSNAGFEVTVLSPHPTYPLGTFKRNWKFRTVKYIKRIKLVNLWTWQPTSMDPNAINRIAYYLFGSLNALLWVICHHNFDVIITSSPPPSTFIPGLVSKMLFGKKWVADVWDLFVDEAVDLGFLKKGGIIEKMFRMFEKICYLHADRILTVTNRIKKGIQSTYKIEGCKIIVCPIGANTDLFYPRKITKKMQVIYTGNIGHAQDLKNVILAMKEIAKYGVKLLIVGGGDAQEAMKKLVKDEKLDEYVIFTGFVERNKIPIVVSESLIAFAPLKKLKGLEYAIPAKTYDYMACGIPVIACGSLELRDLINKSGAGMFVDNNPKSIADAVIYLLKNQKERDEMGTKGIKYIEKYYNGKNITKNLEKEIYNLLKSCVLLF